ncbi:MAG: hypothetical protein JWM47_3473 [Acidimicrobiales bacterium]|nr:hypothetical protein [Acidimicrobiales bacterium]
MSNTTAGSPRRRILGATLFALTLMGTTLGSATAASAGGVQSWNRFGNCRYELVVAYVNHGYDTNSSGFEKDLEHLCGDLRPNPS